MANCVGQGAAPAEFQERAQRENIKFRTRRSPGILGLVVASRVVESLYLYDIPKLSAPIAEYLETVSWLLREGGLFILFVTPP